jgi:hypothetical protein
MISDFFWKEVNCLRRALLVLGLTVGLCMSAHGATYIVEAESYVASHNAGGLSIYVTACSGASEGYAVEGYDYPGDWIEVILNMPETGTFADSLRSASTPTGIESDYASTIFAGGIGGQDLISAFHTVGLGIG